MHVLVSLALIFVGLPAIVFSLLISLLFTGCVIEREGSACLSSNLMVILSGIDKARSVPPRVYSHNSTVFSSKLIRIAHVQIIVNHVDSLTAQTIRIASSPEVRKKTRAPHLAYSSTAVFRVCTPRTTAISPPAHSGGAQAMKFVAHVSVAMFVFSVTTLVFLNWTETKNVLSKLTEFTVTATAALRDLTFTVASAVHGALCAAATASFALDGIGALSSLVSMVFDNVVKVVKIATDIKTVGSLCWAAAIINSWFCKSVSRRLMQVIGFGLLMSAIAVFLDWKTGKMWVTNSLAS
jgi:hypothetical protein